MNKAQKAVEQAKLDAEKKVLKKLKEIYEQAAKDCTKKIKLHSGKIDALLEEWDNLDEVQRSILQSQIYHRKYQILLKRQIDGFLTQLNQKQHETIDQYMKECYETGYCGSIYDLHSQKVPIISPIDQKQMIKAVTINSKVSKKLYGKYVNQLKKDIQSEISRGIATGLTYSDMARNIDSKANVGFNKAMRIARTEGHGVQVQAANDAQHAAKKMGADVVKQWDAALDGRTRKSHRILDGEIRELDEPFSNGMMYPSDPAGGAAEVVNCRCALLQRARWALGEDELEVMKERAAYYGLDKTESFEDFRKKYIKSSNAATSAHTSNSALYNKSVDVSYIENTYGNAHAKAIKKSIENADDDVRAVWNKYQSKFKTSSASYKGSRAYYSPANDSVTLNILSAAKGNGYQTPYQVLYHEYGHMTDFLAARNYGNGQFVAFSELFNGIDNTGKIIWATAGSGGLLGRTAKKELKDRLESIKNAKGFSKKYEAASYLINEIKSNYTLLARADVSDILEGAGIGIKYPLGVGHGLGYWKGRDNGLEIFAEIANPESLKCIKKYFPETYKVFRDILKVVK